MILPRTVVVSNMSRLPAVRMREHPIAPSLWRSRLPDLTKGGLAALGETSKRFLRMYMAEGRQARSNPRGLAPLSRGVQHFWARSSSSGRVGVIAGKEIIKRAGGGI